jgi:N12 class adenine-specific DNA methylase
LTKVDGLGAKRISRIKGLLKVRDAARAYLEAQTQGTTDAGLEAHRTTLNQQYDRFVADHGPINTRANQLALSGDPDLPFLMALEDFDATTQTATKASFFSQRTLEPESVIVHADTASDALIYSMREKGCVDVEYMAELTGKNVKSIIDELVGRIFWNPESSRWETADEYLSGEVVHKLKIVQKLKRPDLAVNVAALQAAQPPPLGPGEIRIKLGAPWIPADVIKQFADDILSR